MDDDSNDPRLHKILQLVLQLTNRPRLPHEDDIDCILEGLLTFTEQREQINPERLPLALFQESVDRAADAVFWITADAAFLYVNQQACHLLGYPREELLKLRLWDINLTCSEEHWKSSWQQSQSSTEPLETFYRRQDGSIFPVEVSSTHLWYGGSELQIAVVHDLTERSQRIAELRESEKRYRALIESQVDLISRYRADSILTFVNDAYCEFFGKTREELIGNTYLFMVAPEYREATMKDTADMVNNPRPTVGEYINYRHNGEECWIQWVVQGVPDDIGQITELQAVGRDITRLKQAESALRESEFFLQKSQSVGRVGSYYFDIQAGTWIDSPMLDEIFGIDESFPKTMEGWISLIHPDDQEEMRWYLARYVVAEHHSFEKEYRIIRHHDQQIRWVYGRGELEFDDQDNAIKMIGTIQEITERKEILEALHFNNFAIERVSDAVCWITEALVIIDVNQAACQMLGYSRDELIGMSITGIDPVKTKEEIASLWVQTREVGSLTFETFHQAKSGRIFPVEIMVSHISHEGKELNCAFARDITQRKQAEEELKNSQALLNESQQFARMGSWSFNSWNNKLIWSDSTFRLFGFAPQAFQPSFEFLLTRIHPDDTPTVSEHFEATRQHKVFHPLTYRVILPDGTVRWILNTGTVEANEAGEMTRFFGMVQDITERKQAEEALQQSEERLRQAVRAGNIGIFDYDHVTNYLYVSPELRSIYGWDDDESAIEENFFRQIHPEDHERIRHNTQRVDDPTGDGSFDVEHRIVTRQGLTCWLNTRSHTFFEGEGDARHPVRTIGAVANITERKNAETAIRQINEELEQRVQERTRALEEANEEIKYFAYIVSHDLRAPLVNLKGFASELRSGLKIVEEGCNSVLPLLDPTQRDKMLYALKEDIPEALRFIESSVSSMDVFTKAILKLSRLGRLQLELVQVDTRSMVEKILETLTYQINQLGVKVRLGDLPHITADVVSLEQIFGNILTNAVAYLDPNRQGEIEIQAESKTGETVFYIRDNGRGIAKEDMNKVFAPFRRAGRQDVPGEGMGLAYVQSLVRCYGGYILCESEAGVGTTFAFTIPKNLTNDSADV